MQQKVAVIGLGYVGLPLALLAARKGFVVTGIDLDTKKVDLINDRKSPIHDDALQAELAETSIEATTDFDKVADADYIIICVPTPVDESKQPDYGPVEGAFKSIAPYLKKGQTLILESTVNPGVCEEIVIPLIEKVTDLKVGADLHLAHCPERINPGDTQWHVGNIPRVIGAVDGPSLERSAVFYEHIIDAPIKRMGSLKEAEAVKIVENTFRDINIAYVNELAMSFAMLGIDVVNVIDGAATKPFAFMAHYPGIGVGGHCIPVDPYYLIEYAKNNGFEHKFLSLARDINSKMPVFTIDLLEQVLEEKGVKLAGTKVALLGLSYKANVGDTRESPSYEALEILKHRGAEVVVFDPYVPEESTVNTLEDALGGVRAVLVCTSHQEFCSLKAEDFTRNNIVAIVDGRNCLDSLAFQDSSVAYRGIGRQ